MSCWSDKYFGRQLYILISSIWINWGEGFMLAYPSVLNPAISTVNGTDIRATSDEASWIDTSLGFSSIIGFVFLPIVMQKFGRRFVTIVISTCLLVSWIIFLFAQSVIALFLGRAFQGIALGCTIIDQTITGEFVIPKRRGWFLMIKKVCVTAGILFCHLAALILSWRQIAGCCIVFGVLGTVMPLYWPESPAFLAYKNRFDESEKSFIWLYGNSNKKELTELILNQKQKAQNKRANISSAIFFKRYLKKDFIKAFLILIFIIVLLESSGRHFFAAYIIQILVQLVGDKSMATYISVSFDTVSVIATCAGTIVIRHFKRRFILMTCGGVSAVLMLIISLLMFLKTKYSLNLDWAIVSVILVFSLASNVGVVPLCFSLMGEVFPLDVKGLGVSLSGVVFACLYSLTIKTSPMLFSAVGLSGTFCIYASLMLVSLVVLYYILPETKDRTLLEIEFEMKGKKFPAVEERPMLS